MPRPWPSQELIDAMVAMYAKGSSVRQVADHFEVSYGKVHMHVSAHMTMRDRNDWRKGELTGG